jgi:hypothetical protein
MAETAVHAECENAEANRDDVLRELNQVTKVLAQDALLAQPPPQTLKTRKRRALAPLALHHGDGGLPIADSLGLQLKSPN